MIDAHGCGCCMSIKIEGYKNYYLHDLKEQIFIEFGNCEKPEDITFENEDFDDEDSEEHFHYCFCLTYEYYKDWPMHGFERLYIKN